MTLNISIMERSGVGVVLMKVEPVCGLVKDEDGREPLQDLVPIVKTEFKVEVKDEIDIFEEAIEHKTDCQSAAVSDAHSSNYQESGSSVINTRSGEETPETKVKCYSEENVRVKRDYISSDSDIAQTYFSARILARKLYNEASANYKRQQHCETHYLSAECENGSRELPNLPSSQCSDKFVCDHCGISYMVKSDLIQHILLHGQKQTPPGNMSKITLNCKSNLILHKTRAGESYKSHLIGRSRTYSGEHRFSCDLCSKSFSYKINLIAHIRTHSGERPFSCDFCSKSFSYKGNLIVHSRIHSGERPFSCDLCSKSFGRKSHLIGHRRTHSGERPFSCDLCSKSFSQKSPLIRHRRTHSGERPFSYDLCSKSFSQKSPLIRHRRTHSGERPFSCDLCSKSFGRKSHLIGHRRTHYGERPFSCDLCGKSFRHKSVLIAHCRTHCGRASF